MRSLHIPTQHVALFVKDLACRHGVVFKRTSQDALADLITNLSDDSAISDETEHLIVALARAKMINDTEVLALLCNHIDEKYKKAA